MANSLIPIFFIEGNPLTQAHLNLLSNALTQLQKQYPNDTIPKVILSLKSDRELKEKRRPNVCIENTSYQPFHFTPEERIQLAKATIADYTAKSDPLHPPIELLTYQIEHQAIPNPPQSTPFIDERAMLIHLKRDEVRAAELNQTSAAYYYVLDSENACLSCSDLSVSLPLGSDLFSLADSLPTSILTGDIDALNQMGKESFVALLEIMTSAVSVEKLNRLDYHRKRIADVWLQNIEKVAESLTHTLPNIPLLILAKKRQHSSAYTFYAPVSPRSEAAYAAICQAGTSDLEKAHLLLQNYLSTLWFHWGRNHASVLTPIITELLDQTIPSIENLLIRLYGIDYKEEGSLGRRVAFIEHHLSAPLPS